MEQVYDLNTFVETTTPPDDCCYAVFLVLLLPEDIINDENDGDLVAFGGITTHIQSSAHASCFLAIHTVSYLVYCLPKLPQGVRYYFNEIPSFDAKVHLSYTESNESHRKEYTSDMIATETAEKIQKWEKAGEPQLHVRYFIPQK